MKIRDVEGLPEKLKNIIEEIDDIQDELEKKKDVIVTIPVGNGSGGSGGGIPEAPVDGKTYGRKDATWEEVTGEGGTSAGQKTLTDGATIEWLADVPGATVTLGGDRTLQNPTGVQAGATYTLIVKQDGTGNRTLSFDTDYIFHGKIVPVLQPEANSITMLRFYYDGSKMYCETLRNFGI